MNKQAIRELMDLNFNGVTRYPGLDFEDIVGDDAASLATTYQALIASGGMTAQDADEDAFRGKLGPSWMRRASGEAGAGQ